ncbi:hypothetical protein GCM10023310_62650 [Paenibacillus vulneris]|uniref:PhBC6A51 family helix-turn-helix protein n=1 Tax=Paenibacillus vulneris TaxID=1133364 RepID=A0ABW3UCS8_9BACL
MKITKRKGNYKRGRQPLNDIHYAAIDLLAGKYGRKSKSEIADILGINRRTLYRYRNRADFRRELVAATNRVVGEKLREYRPPDPRNLGVAEITQILQAVGFAVG